MVPGHMTVWQLAVGVAVSLLHAPCTPEQAERAEGTARCSWQRPAEAMQNTLAGVHRVLDMTSSIRS